MNKKTFTWIDSMKGIAICSVVMVHIGVDCLPVIMSKLVGAGKYGVQIFFLLSVFLTFKSLDKIDKRSDIIKWWLRKFIKLIPIYYLMLIVCAIFEGGHSYWLGCEKTISVYNMLSHCLFIHGLFPHYIDSIIGVEWYLGLLAIFYIVAPLLHKYINSLEKSIFVFVLSIPLCYRIREVLHSCVPIVEDDYIYTTFIDSFGLVSQLSVILLGIVLYFVICELDLSDIKEKRIISYGLLCFAGIMIMGQIFHNNRLWMINEPTIFGIWFFVVLLSQKIWQCPVIDNCVFRFLGRKSYSIYLIHFFIIQKIREIDFLNVNNIIIEWMVQFATVLCMSIIIGMLLEKLYEQPFVCALEKLISLKKDDV